MIVRAVFRCDSLRVSLWSTICPLFGRLKRPKKKGLSDARRKASVALFFSNFFSDLWKYFSAEEKLSDARRKASVVLFFSNFFSKDFHLLHLKAIVLGLHRAFISQLNASFIRFDTISWTIFTDHYNNGHWINIASRLIELRSSVVSVLRSLIASRGTTCPSHDQTTFCQLTGSSDDLSSCSSRVGPVLHYLRNRLASLEGELIYTFITTYSVVHTVEKTMTTVAIHSGFSSVHEWIFRLLLKISVDRSNYNES